MLIGTIIIGITQIKLLKKDIEIRNRRLAIEKSIEFMDRLAAKAIPLADTYKGKLRTNNLIVREGLCDENFQLTSE